MSYQMVRLERRERIAFITLSRPEAGNFLGGEMGAELEAACRQVAQDQGVWAVVLSGAGECFCTGGDAEGAVAVETVAGLEPPVIAALNGDALGLGLALALAADLRLAAAPARLGVSPFPPHPAGLTQRLPRLVGRGKALEMLLLGESYSAAQANQFGLVHRVVPGEELSATAAGWAERLATKAPIAARFAKEAVSKGMDLTLPQGLRLEADLYFLLHTTADRREGITAFLEKRPPQFKGE